MKLPTKTKFFALTLGLALTFTTHASEVSPAEARAIAKENNPTN
jgi:hypothetical protein